MSINHKFSWFLLEIEVLKLVLEFKLLLYKETLFMVRHYSCEMVKHIF